MGNENLLNEAKLAAQSAENFANQANEALEEIKELVININEEQITSIQNSKNAIKEVLLEKGVEIDDTTPFEDYASKIGDIQGGNNNGGDGALFDLVAVTSYQPAYNLISSLTLSGMGVDEMGYYDLTNANGIYQVTPATANNQPNERIYKHTSQEYYIFYIPEDTTGMYYSYGWALNTSVASNPWSVLMMAPVLMKELSNGDNTWWGEMNMLSMKITISNVIQEKIAQAIKLKKVIGYNVNTLQYTFDNEEIDCSESEYSDVKEHQIYNFNGTTLLGRPLDCEGGSHLRTYVPGRTEPVTVLLRNDRNTNTNGNYFPAWQYPTFYTSEPSRFSLATIDGKSCIYSNTEAEMMWPTNGDDFGSGKYGYYPSTANRKWSFGTLFHGGNQKNKKQILMAYLSNVARVYIDVDWTASTPQAVLYVGDNNAVATYSNTNLASGWHHFMMTYDFDTKTLTMYVDGVSRGTYTVSLERTNYFDGTHPYIGRDSGSWYIGHVCEIKFWDIPLTQEQVTAEYNRAINS